MFLCPIGSLVQFEVVSYNMNVCVQFLELCEKDICIVVYENNNILAIALKTITFVIQCSPTCPKRGSFCTLSQELEFPFLIFIVSFASYMLALYRHNFIERSDIIISSRGMLFPMVSACVNLETCIGRVRAKPDERFVSRTFFVVVRFSHQG